MISPTLPIRRLIRRLHLSESGTALTEFAITLPVYLVFMTGILTLFNLQQAVLFSHQNASAEFWEDAIRTQTTYLTEGMTPIGGIANSVSYYSEAEELFSFASILDTGSAGGGMYIDSGTKGIAANAMPLIGANITPQPQLNLSPNVLNSQSHTYRLMDDQLLSTGGGGGIIGILSQVLDASGARPSLAAGYRYGVVGGVDTRSYDLPGFDNSNPKARYNASAPTYPDERWVALALTRIEMSRGHDAYDELLEFGIVTGSGAAPRAKPPNAESGPCGGNSAGGMSPEDEAALQQCADQAKAANDCKEDCDANSSTPFLCRLGCPSPPDEDCGPDVANPQDGFGDIGFGDAGGGSC